jgi:hypothetical protein
MRKLIVLLVVASFLGTIANAAGRDNDDAATLFNFHHMTTVTAPFTGTANPIRNLAGGGTPWQIASAKAELKSNGAFEVTVRGLTLVSTGANPVPNFAVVLSCQSKDAAGAPTVVNQVVGIVPATTTGNADFAGNVTLTSPCLAPIVFVGTAPTATASVRWLAISGF